jgi:hypothetical protein
MSTIIIKINEPSLIIDLVSLAKKARKNFMQAPREGNKNKYYEECMAELGPLSRLNISPPPNEVLMNIILLEALEYWGNYNE